MFLNMYQIVTRVLDVFSDADLTLEHDADGVVVSNHGGRQADGSVAAVRAPPGRSARRPGGRRGRRRVFRADLDLTVALAGATDVDGIGRSVLRERPESR
ncbi:hypothetical protein BRD03_08860 [Halobacteriales archaeon QS_9_68_17]|nr:MAG: hypothetical protein BRD03_08860 [Halobacteriales archaeon QS_9_68_17]